MIISIDSVIFAYHSICLSSVPPFLRTIQWAYTVVYHGLKYRHATRPRLARHGAVSAWGSIGIGAVSVYNPLLSTLVCHHETKGEYFCILFISLWLIRAGGRTFE